jgi:hypothetical protein
LLLLLLLLLLGRLLVRACRCAIRAHGPFVRKVVLLGLLGLWLVLDGCAAGRRVVLLLWRRRILRLGLWLCAGRRRVMLLLLLLLRVLLGMLLCGGRRGWRWVGLAAWRGRKVLLLLLVLLLLVCRGRVRSVLDNPYWTANIPYPPLSGGATPVSWCCSASNQTAHDSRG